MKKNTKEKGSEYIGLKECFGTTTLSFTHALTGVLMSSMLMVYMTEYSGISNGFCSSEFCTDGNR